MQQEEEAIFSQLHFASSLIFSLTRKSYSLVLKSTIPHSITALEGLNLKTFSIAYYL